jgi:hypothetical protein
MVGYGQNRELVKVHFFHYRATLNRFPLRAKPSSQGGEGDTIR